jgi:hypothetical protein
LASSEKLGPFGDFAKRTYSLLETNQAADQEFEHSVIFGTLSVKTLRREFEHFWNTHRAKLPDFSGLP